MGYNTTVVVMNDSLHDIEKDPEFGKNLAQAIKSESIRHYRPGSQYVRALGSANAAEVIESHHADGQVAVVVGGNCGEVLGYAGTCRNGNEYVKDETERKTQYLKRLAHELGFRLVKLPKKGK